MYKIKYCCQKRYQDKIHLFGIFKIQEHTYVIVDILNLYKMPEYSDVYNKHKAVWTPVEARQQSWILLFLSKTVNTKIILKLNSCKVCRNLLSVQCKHKAVLTQTIPLAAYLVSFKNNKLEICQIPNTRKYFRYVVKLSITAAQQGKRTEQEYVLNRLEDICWLSDSTLKKTSKLCKL